VEAGIWVVRIDKVSGCWRVKGRMGEGVDVVHVFSFISIHTFFSHFNALG